MERKGPEAERLEPGELGGSLLAQGEGGLRRALNTSSSGGVALEVVPTGTSEKTVIGRCEF